MRVKNFHFCQIITFTLLLFLVFSGVSLASGYPGSNVSDLIDGELYEAWTDGDVDTTKSCGSKLEYHFTPMSQVTLTGILVIAKEPGGLQNRSFYLHASDGRDYRTLKYVRIPGDYSSNEFFIEIPEEKRGFYRDYDFYARNGGTFAEVEPYGLVAAPKGESLKDKISSYDFPQKFINGITGDQDRVRLGRGSYGCTGGYTYNFTFDSPVVLTVLNITGYGWRKTHISLSASNDGAIWVNLASFYDKRYSDYLHDVYLVVPPEKRQAYVYYRLSLSWAEPYRYRQCHFRYISEITPYGFEAESPQDPTGCSNKIHLYDANDQIVNPGDTITFGKQYYFGTEPDSGCRLETNHHDHYWGFYAVYCNEDGTDCVADSKKELTGYYKYITPDGTEFTAGSSPVDRLLYAPPDEQHTHKWMVVRTRKFSSGGAYQLHKEDVTSSVTIDFSHFKYKYDESKYQLGYQDCKDKISSYDFPQRFINGITGDQDGVRLGKGSYGCTGGYTYNFTFDSPVVLTVLNITGYGMRRTSISLSASNDGDNWLKLAGFYEKYDVDDIYLMVPPEKRQAYTYYRFSLSWNESYWDRECHFRYITEITPYGFEAPNITVRITGPKSIDVSQEDTAEFTINTTVSPADSPYTLGPITYSIPELGITDQALPEGQNSLSIDLPESPAESYHITASVCINELPGKWCGQAEEVLRVTAPEPRVAVNCPRQVIAGRDVTCSVTVDASYGTPEVRWLVDGKDTGQTGTDFSHVFTSSGTHHVTAVASLMEIPSVSGSADVSIKVGDPQISVSVRCRGADGWSHFWTSKRMCPIGPDDGSVRVSVTHNAPKLARVIKVKDADTKEVIATLNPEDDEISLTNADLNIDGILQKRNLTVEVSFEELPDRHDAKDIVVILVPEEPQFEAHADTQLGKVVVHIKIKDYSPDRHGTGYSASVMGRLSATTKSTDAVELPDSGEAAIDFPFWAEGQLRLYPKVYLSYEEKPIKTYNLPYIDIESRLPIPIKVVLRSSSGHEGYAPFSTTVKAYGSFSIWKRTKGLEWLLDEEVIAGGPDEVVKAVDLNIDEPGAHTLVVRGYHNDGDQVDEAASDTFTVHATPDDVTDGFELKLTYNRDATITVQTGRITRAQELVRSPIRERMKEIDWKVISDTEEAASGHSKITRWTVDLSSLDLSKDYRLAVYWHTNLGRSFIAEKDIDESIIRARGVDLSKAEIRIMRLTASKQIAYLSGVSSFLLKAAKLQTTFQVFNEAKDKVGEAKDARIVVNPMEIGGSSYTVKCKVTNPQDKTVCEKEITVETGDDKDDEDEDEDQKADDKAAETAQVFAERVSLNCMVYDPFERQVRCVGENLYSISFFRRHGYEVNYCISSPETSGQAPPETGGQASEDKQVCNKQRVFFTFETGGEKTFNLDFTYRKGEDEHTVKRTASVSLPSSIEELLSDPEKGLAVEVELYDPVRHIIGARAFIKDRHYNYAFVRRYRIQMELINAEKETVVKPRLGQVHFYYEAPPSLESSYEVKAEVYAKDDLDSGPVYEISRNFDINTLTENMAGLEIKYIHSKNGPWGVYMATVKLQPVTVGKYLGWKAVIKNEGQEKVAEAERFSRKIIKLPAPGVYTVEFTAFSKDNPAEALVTKTYRIEAVNEKPQINIEAINPIIDRRGRHVLVVEATCSDSDGRIKKMEINACNCTRTYKRSVFNCGDAKSTEVVLKACDDAGECATVTRTAEWGE